MMGLFGKRPDPKTQVREWSSKLRAEQNKIERQINQIKREEEKVAASLKQARAASRDKRQEYRFCAAPPAADGRGDAKSAGVTANGHAEDDDAAAADEEDDDIDIDDI